MSRPHTTARRVASLSFALAIGVWACEEPPEPVAEVIRPVRTMTVQVAEGGGQQKAFSGVCQSANASQLSFKVSGNLDKLHAEVGDEIKSGQVIAEVDSSDLELKVEEARAGVEQARAQERNARANYERIRSLYESQSASKADLDSARTGQDSAKAQVRTARKRLQQAMSQVSYTTLKAPQAGVISEVGVRVNENIQAGQPIVTLATGDRLEVVVGVPEQLITRVKEGSSVKVTFDTLPNEVFDATLTKVGISTGRQSTYPVTALLNAPSEKIRSGMAAQVAFSFEADADEPEGISVPTAAVGEDLEGRFVFVVAKEGDGMGVVKRRSVKVGDITSGGLQVLEGLKEGELLVTAGVNTIKPEQQVKLLEGGR